MVPELDARLMITPEPRSTMAGSTSLVRITGAITLASRWRSMRSTGVSRIWSMCPGPT